MQLLIAFVAGALYAVCAMVTVDVLHRRPETRHRWHRLPGFVRGLLIAAWPFTVVWFFMDDSHVGR